MRHEPQRKREIFRPLPAGWYAFHFDDEEYLREYRQLQDQGWDEQKALKYAQELITYPDTKRLSSQQERDLFRLFNYLKWRLSGRKEIVEMRPVQPDARQQLGKILQAQELIEQLAGLLALYVSQVHEPDAVGILKKAAWENIDEKEIFQMTFEKLMTRVVPAFDYRGSSELGAFVTVAVLNLVADFRRVRQRHRRDSQGNRGSDWSTGDFFDFEDLNMGEPPDIAAELERRRFVRQHLPTLLDELQDSPIHLEVVQLVLCGLTQQEIGEVLGEHRSTVMRGIQQARARLEAAGEAEQFKILRQVIQEVIAESKPFRKPRGNSS